MNIWGGENKWIVLCLFEHIFIGLEYKVQTCVNYFDCVNIVEGVKGMTDRQRK